MNRFIIQKILTAFGIVQLVLISILGEINELCINVKYR